jgi:hypothetical protein
MTPSLWLVAALVLIPAVQVPAVLYLARYVEVDESELPALPTGYTSPPREWGLAESEAVSVPDAAVCTRCGTANETGYRFCRECAALL